MARILFALVFAAASLAGARAGGEDSKAAAIRDALATGQPIVLAIAAEFPARVAGQNTRIIETTMFMGRKQRVLVTHLGYPELKGSAMIYAVGVDRPEFEALLAGITRAPNR